MINIHLHRRDYFTDQEVYTEDNILHVVVGDAHEQFDLSGLTEGEHILEDCLTLPYNPVQKIIVTQSGDIEVQVFLDDPHTRGIPCRFKKEKITISEFPLFSDIIKQETERISQLAVSRNYELLPQYKRDNIYVGSPASDSYPEYLTGEAGKQTIAKMNGYFRQKSKQVIASMSTMTRAQVLSIGDPFPKTAEEMLEILNGK